MGLWTSYRLRWRRKRLQYRARRKQGEMQVVEDRTKKIRKNDVLLFCCFRNEAVRFPYFFEYYRSLGVNHFIMVDNDSDDGGREYVAAQSDVSIWTTQASYRASRYGMDWITALQRKYANGHWCLTVDPDEFFVYPFCDTRSIRALTDWLDSSNLKSFGAMLLDMYPKGPVDDVPYKAGQDPTEIACWFDAGNYMITRNWEYNNLWIQGGPRARVFMKDSPDRAPALNKVPLVKWKRNCAYVDSTHMVLPRGLNLVFDDKGGEKASGALLHTKFLNTFTEKAREELERKEHYDNGFEYRSYAESADANPDLWCKWSEKYINWRQLEILGIMSKGNWA